MSLRIRRGTEAQRSSLALDQGEIVYTTDTRRLYVGDGVTQGGTDPLAGLAGVGLHYNTSTGLMDVNYSGLTTDAITEGVQAGKQFFTVERAQDAAAALLTSGIHTNITFTYTTTQDNANRIDAVVTLDGTGITSVEDDTSPKLGGSLDLNSFDITGSGDISTTGFFKATAGLSGDLNINAYDITGTGSIITTGSLESSGAIIHANAGGSSNVDILTVKTYHNDVDAGGAFFFRARGTSASPISLSSNDAIFNLGFSGRTSDGSETVAAAIGTEVDGSVSAGILPGKFVVYTANSSGALAPALTIDKTQNAIFSGRIEAIDGSAMVPSIAFASDGGIDSGFFHPGDGIVCVTINTNEKVRVDSGGMRVEGFMKVKDFGVDPLPNPPEAGMIVLHGGSFKGYNGSSWVTLG